MRRVPVFHHQPRRRQPLGEVYRPGPHGGPASGRRDCAGGNVRRPVRQEKVLDGASGRGAVLVVAKPRQPAFEDIVPAPRA